MAWPILTMAQAVESKKTTSVNKPTATVSKKPSHVRPATQKKATKSKKPTTKPLSSKKALSPKPAALPAPATVSTVQATNKTMSSEKNSGSPLNEVKGTRFASILGDAVEVYDSPEGKQATALLSRFTPVEVLTSAGQYTKIRDIWGAMGWVLQSQVDDKNLFVLADRPVTSVLKEGDSTASLQFEVVKGVALKVIEKKGEWLRVAHADGSTGFVLGSHVLGFVK